MRITILKGTPDAREKITSAKGREDIIGNARVKTMRKIGIVIIMMLMVAWLTAGASENDIPKKFKGEVGDFYFYHADLQNVLLFFARQYKLNIIIDPGISGTVTCQMVQVPWDQALDVILRQQGLAMVEEGKVQRATKIKQ